MKMQFIMGPCALESEELNMSAAIFLRTLQDAINVAIAPHSIEVIYKSCYNKANRTSRNSYHGMWIDEGMRIMQKIKDETELRVTCDVHSLAEIDIVKDVIDIIQIPQSLSRYTFIIEAAADTGCDISIKKGVFMSRSEITEAHKKAYRGKPIILLERGNKFGYEDMIVDMLNIKHFKKLGAIAGIDAGHPAGNRDNVFTLARAGVAAGAELVFMECHPNPNKALCDGNTSVMMNETLFYEVMNLVQLKLLIEEM